MRCQVGGHQEAPNNAETDCGGSFPSQASSSAGPAPHKLWLFSFSFVPKVIVVGFASLELVPSVRWAPTGTRPQLALVSRDDDFPLYPTAQWLFLKFCICFD